MNSLAQIFSSGKSVDDWLSPILVKELRQGMRGRVFMISFLMLQMFLVVLVLANLAAQSDRQQLEVQDVVFWLIVGFALLILMPLRGLAAIAQETKNRTIETIMLTRLTAWRVVFGKWSALFAQSLLLVSAVFPYVVLRYFIGGDDVVNDFKAMLLMLWFSGILIATTIAISGLASAIMRVIILIGLIIAGTTALNGFNAFFPSGTDSVWETLGWLVDFGFFVPALLFELTASGFAPISENHAIRRRLLALAFFALSCLLASMSPGSPDMAIFVSVAVLIGTCYFDLAEKPRLVPRMVRSFAQRGFLGRLTGIFLLPGWPSALLFSLVVIPGAMIGIYLFNAPDNMSEGIALILSIFGSVLVPVTICHIFWPKMNQVLLMVLLYNVLILAVAGVLRAFAFLLHSHIDLLFALLPIPTHILARSTDSDTFKIYGVFYIMGNASVLFLLGTILLLSTRPYFREVSAIFWSARNPKPEELKST